MPIDTEHLTLVEALDGHLAKVDQAIKTPSEIMRRQHLKSLISEITKLRDYITREKCNFIIFEKQ